MTHYLVQPRDRTFVNSYGLSPSAKTMARNPGKNISKKVSIKYSQNLLDHT